MTQNSKGYFIQHSTFRNWRNNPMGAKKKHLSSTFPVKVGRNGNKGMELTFQDEFGKQITFYLSDYDTALVRMNIERFVLGNENVTREMFNLDELEKCRDENQKHSQL